MSKEAPRTPKPMALPPGKPLSMFPLTPVDGFVLSRIDGSVSDRDLLALTGLDAAKVQASLAKLEREGLIAFGDGRPPLHHAPAPEAPSVPPSPAPPPLLTAPPSRFSEAPELQEDVDLELSHRLRILETHATLAELNHYDVLGAPRVADKKAIKRAYYEIAALFHPDRFFRKRLGTFKAKMEAIFVRATDAHDTLTDAERRAEYDAYIGERDMSQAIEADLVLEVPPVQAPALSSPPSVARPTPTPSMAPQTTGVQLSEQARRDALARRLMGGARPPSGAMRAVSIPVAAPVDTDALKRHYESKVAAVRSRVVKDHLEKANAAVERAKWAVAATNFRAALDAAPDDPVLQVSLAEAQAKANEVLFTSYRKQAAYEEKNGLHSDAARSWQRAARARPEDAQSHERAAACMVKAGDHDLHEAAKLAQKAIALEPDKAAYHVTLSLVYSAAGLGLNARRELETAARLAPEDATIQTLLTRGSKG